MESNTNQSARHTDDVVVEEVITTETVTDTDTTPGFFGRMAENISDHPVMAAGLLVATAGAGVLGYQQYNAHFGDRDLEVPSVDIVADAVEIVHAIANLPFTTVLARLFG
jgi:hypothetical protein